MIQESNAREKVARKHYFHTMFSSEGNILIFAIILTFIIFGGLIGGYILHDWVTMTPENWKGVIVMRFVLHLVGVLPFILLLGGLMESFWKGALIGVAILAVMNFNPILDLVKGPIEIDQIEPEEWVREEYNNPSSDVDFSTHEVPMIRLEQNGRSIMLTKERWDKLVANCDGENPIHFIGLEYLEVELEWSCD